MGNKQAFITGLVLLVLVPGCHLVSGYESEDPGAQRTSAVEPDAGQAGGETDGQGVAGDAAPTPPSCEEGPWGVSDNVALGPATFDLVVDARGNPHLFHVELGELHHRYWAEGRWAEEKLLLEVEGTGATLDPAGRLNVLSNTASEQLLYREWEQGRGWSEPTLLSAGAAVSVIEDGPVLFGATATEETMVTYQVDPAVPLPDGYRRCNEREASPVELRAGSGGGIAAASYYDTENEALNWITGNGACDGGYTWLFSPPLGSARPAPVIIDGQGVIQLLYVSDQGQLLRGSWNGGEEVRRDVQQPTAVGLDGLSPASLDAALAADGRLVVSYQQDGAMHWAVQEAGTWRTAMVMQGTGDRSCIRLGPDQRVHLAFGDASGALWYACAPL